MSAQVLFLKAAIIACYAGQKGFLHMSHLITPNIKKTHTQGLRFVILGAASAYNGEEYTQFLLQPFAITDLIPAKEPAVLPTMAFATSVQISTQ